MVDSYPLKTIGEKRSPEVSQHPHRLQAKTVIISLSTVQYRGIDPKAHRYK